MLTLKNKNKLIGKPIDKKKYYVSSIMESDTTYTFTLRSPKYKNVFKIQIDREQRKFKVINDATVKYYIKNIDNGIRGYIGLDEIRNIDKLIDRLRNYGIK